VAKKVVLYLIVLVLVFALLHCSRVGNLEVVRQVTGLETNCYLIYDLDSREAALIDVGGPIDSLLSIIETNGLTIKYFLCTHSHEDHIIGIPTIRGRFPEAKLCLHELEFEDMFIRKEWAYSFFGEETINEWAKDPEFRKVIEFDPTLFGEPDIYVEDSLVLKLGKYSIDIIHSPGHSPGGVCYYVGRFLFSGDCLFKGSVGRVDVLHSSRDDQIESVRRLYQELPDSTIVYPGHGESTTIGAEKRENEKITVDSVYL